MPSTVIIIKTQAELDQLPAKFTEYTEIRIEGKNLSVTKRYEGADVTAYGSASVRASGSASVTASGSASVTASGSASVTASGSASVRASDSASVTASGSASVRASDSASVTAYGSASVRASDSASVRAYGNSITMVLSALVVLAAVKHYAVVMLEGVKVKKFKRAKTATIIRRKIWKYTAKDYSDIHGLETLPDGRVTLFKSVRDDHTDFYTGKIKYEGTVECPDWDGNHERECGGGLHVSPTAELALSYHQGKLLKVAVALEDIAVYSPNLTKVRCRRVEVLGPVEGRP